MFKFIKKRLDAKKIARAKQHAINKTYTKMTGYKPCISSEITKKILSEKPKLN